MVNDLGRDGRWYGWQIFYKDYYLSLSLWSLSNLLSFFSYFQSNLTPNIGRWEQQHWGWDQIIKYISRRRRWRWRGFILWFYHLILSLTTTKSSIPHLILSHFQIKIEWFIIHSSLSPTIFWEFKWEEKERYEKEEKSSKSIFIFLFLSTTTIQSRIS